MPQHVNLTVKIGGKKISPISYCSISQRIDWHHSFEILLPVDGFTRTQGTILNQAKDFIGQKLELSFKTDILKGDDSQNEFHGIVTEVSLSRRNKGNKEILVRGYSPTILLDGKPNCVSFTEQGLNEIVSELHKQIPKNDLKVNLDPAFSSEIPYIVQYRESNYHFLNRIADKYGEWCFYDGTELNFGRIDKSQKTNLPIDRNLSDFEFSLKVQDLDYDTISYNYLENKTYTQKTKDLSVNDLDQYGEHVLSRSEKIFKQSNTVYSPEFFGDEKGLTSFEETKRFSHSKDLVFSEGVSDIPYINVGSVINITGEKKGEENYGEFIIISLNHTIDITGNYENHFTAIPAQANLPPVNRNISQPMSEIQPAVVKDNDDPENLGRVKVQFFWQIKDQTTPWMRTIHSHGGKSESGNQHGFYFVPEIGDEVMVGFETDNPDNAFVLGNVYHSNASPDHWYDADNKIKSIRTRSGNQIIFIDEEGSEEIRILNKDDASPTNEISLSLNDNGKITIKSEGELEISAQSIKIKADDDITVDSGKTTKFSANDYKLEANSGIELSGQKLEIEGTNTTMKGSAQLKMEGKQTDISATMLKMEGSGQAELKGATTKVSGSAITEIKGGIVKIN